MVKVSKISIETYKDKTLSDVPNQVQTFRLNLALNSASEDSKTSVICTFKIIGHSASIYYESAIFFQIRLCTYIGM